MQAEEEPSLQPKAAGDISLKSQMTHQPEASYELYTVHVFCSKSMK